MLAFSNKDLRVWHCRCLIFLFSYVNCLTLDRLQTVEIRYLEGSKVELLFIKLLLAHSPSLQKFTIRPSEASDIQKRLDIAMDIMQFPRASTKEKMFYLNPNL
uniref:FBD domain-containing protein n=1 Tax=Lactuca sativa TaxID=4236 RepID=A0A9R1XY55_LACSA|nr:hypothetical protein LSAT_V11C100032370 [Lactuca sativa]